MNQRMQASIRLAKIFIVAILATAAFFTFSMERDATFEHEVVWSVPFGDVQSLQVIDLDGDGSDDVYAQNRSAFSVFSGSGDPLFGQELDAPMSLTMGDPDGDGGENVVAFLPAGRVRAFEGARELWSVTLANVADPARSAVIRFGSGTQVVVGDMGGQLVGLNGATGAELWRAQLSGSSEARGLDDVMVDGDRILVAANRNGTVVAYGPTGASLWSASTNGLRRMRTFDADGDGASEVYYGGEGGTVYVVDTDGLPLWSGRIGQQVVEIRDGEIDGDPISREILVGGRDGGVFAFSASGTLLWSESMGQRVSDMRAIDLDGDGADEAVVGGERGGFTVFAGRTGKRFPVDIHSGPVASIDEGFLTETDQVVVAAGPNVSVLQIERRNAPFFYSPLVAGLLLSLAVAGAAVFIGSLPEKQSARVVVTDSSPEGLLARRRMLFENIADVEGLRSKGDIEGSMALNKLENLREQLAETDQELRQAGVKISMESRKCPNCAGRVRLGSDRCDYCGEVVIS